MADAKLVERNIPGMNNRATRFAEVEHAENAADTLRRVSSYFAREKKLVAGMLAAVALGTPAVSTRPACKAGPSMSSPERGPDRWPLSFCGC